MFFPKVIYEFRKIDEEEQERQGSSPDGSDTSNN
jgi:hypothetical protein